MLHGALKEVTEVHGENRAFTKGKNININT